MQLYYAYLYLTSHRRLSKVFPTLYMNRTTNIIELKLYCHLVICCMVFFPTLILTWHHMIRVVICCMFFSNTNTDMTSHDKSCNLLYVFFPTLILTWHHMIRVVICCMFFSNTNTDMTSHDKSCNLLYVFFQH